MTVENLKHTMSYQEFIEWQEYYNDEPFLSDRLEIQLAKIGQTNLLTGMNKINIDDDFFLVRKFEKENKKEKDFSKEELNNIIDNLF